MPNTGKTGVGGTVDAFNFIRRVAFPSTSRVLAIFAAVGLGSSAVSFLIEGGNTAQILVFACGVFVLPAIVGELLSSRLFLWRDRILDFRRLMGIEVVSSLLMTVFLILFSIVGALTGLKALWEIGFLMGLTVSLPVRFLTPMAMSSFSAWRMLFAGLSSPLLTTIGFLVLSPFLPAGSNPTPLRTTLVVASGLVLSAVGVSLIIRNVDKAGLAEIHHSPMSLFRSFLDHWLGNTPIALEERLLSLSTEDSIETKILAFWSSDSPKASLVVSNFHPGPYRDMGSGGLPSEMKRALEESHHGIVQVPHGVSNHKLNIVSHKDIDRLLAASRQNFPSDYSIRVASSMIREREGEAVVSGQAFGRVVLLTVTLAPAEMEDLPTEVSVEIEREASKRGFEVLIIDAHNSLVGQTSITPLQAGRITTAAERVLDRLKTMPQGSFSIGSAYDPLNTYTIKDGIGPGGLSAIAVKTGNEAASYITIDGNNMQQGLRDQILRALKETGIEDAEVLTTDTHLVTGQVRSRLGYYPVGAALPTASFITQITTTVQKAMANLEESSAGISKFSLKMPVLGSEAFQSISGFIVRIAKRIGRAFLWLEISSLILGLVILFV